MIEESDWDLSPLLFILSSKEIFNEAFANRDMGIKVSEVPISYLSYADYTVIIANNIVELQRMCNILNEKSRHYGPNINPKKKTNLLSKVKRKLHTITLRMGLG